MNPSRIRHSYSAAVVMCTLLLLTGCSDEPGASNAGQGDQPAESFEPIGLWEPNANADGVQFATELPGADVYEIANGLNLSWAGPDFDDKPKTLMVIKKVEGGVAYVVLHGPCYFSYQMGSAGAHGFMASLVYSLTSVPGIDAVDLDFAEGDHASPGRYTRSDYPNPN